MGSRKMKYQKHLRIRRWMIIPIIFSALNDSVTDRIAQPIFDMLRKIFLALDVLNFFLYSLYTCLISLSAIGLVVLFGSWTYVTPDIYGFNTIIKILIVLSHIVFFVLLFPEIRRVTRKHASLYKRRDIDSGKMEKDHLVVVIKTIFIVLTAMFFISGRFFLAFSTSALFIVFCFLGVRTFNEKDHEDHDGEYKYF